MKTTVEIGDDIYRQIKARAALNRQTVKSYFLEALKDKLEKDCGVRDESPSWMTTFGKGDAGALRELQSEIDAEFSRISEDDWK
jgi:hypothetical protein